MLVVNTPITKKRIVIPRVKVEWLYAFPNNGSADNFKISWEDGRLIQYEVITQNVSWENNVLRTHLLEREPGEDATDTTPVRYPYAVFGNVVIEFGIFFAELFTCTMWPA